MRSALPFAAVLAVLSLSVGCLVGSVLDGANFACDAESDCSAGFRCWRGLCTQDAGWPEGVACITAEDCASGFCTTGRCCNRACTGNCERCDDPADLGFCQVRVAGSTPVPLCGLALCDGTNATCDGSCTADVYCAPQAWCASSLRCEAKRALGANCPRPEACDSGFCADGRCCESACSQPCDRCNLADAGGRCRTATLGSVPSSSCGRFACSGAAATCPTNCTSDAGCLAGSSCSAYRVCQGPVHTLSDDFDDNSIDTTLWNNYGDPPSGTVADERNGRAEIAVSAFAAQYAGYYSRSSYDAIGSRLQAELVDPGNQTRGSFETYFLLVSGDGQQMVGFDIYGGRLRALERIDGGYLEPARVDLDAGQRFLRMRITGGNVILDYSGDGGTFTRLATVPARPFLQTVFVDMGAGEWNPEDAGGVGIWDNLNP